MYFLKKNALNVIIFVLIFGVIGTLINLVIPSGSYDYEEHYTIEGDITPNTSSELNALMNENINNQFTEKTAALSHQPGSNRFELSIHTDDRGDIDAVRSKVNNIIDEQGYSVGGTAGANIYQVENNALKIFIIVLSLFVGFIIGLVVSLLNRNISTDEDFEHYLGEKTLGTF